MELQSLDRRVQEYNRLFLGRPERLQNIRSPSLLAEEHERSLGGPAQQKQTGSKQPAREHKQSLQRPA